MSSAGPQHGHRTMALTYGAANAKDALVWPEPKSSSSGNNSNNSTSRRSHNQSFNSSSFVESSRQDTSSHSDGRGGTASAAAMRVLQETTHMVPVHDQGNRCRSEARDAYAYYVPVDALLRPEELEKEIEVTRPPEPPKAKPKVQRVVEHGFSEGGAQTNETSFKGPLSPPKPIYAGKPKHKASIRPPFFPYGQGNRKPTSSFDFMASYNVNPVMHKLTSKEKHILDANGHPVFESALIRLLSDPSAYNAKNLAASQAAAAAEEEEESSFHQNTSRNTDNDDHHHHEQEGYEDNNDNDDNQELNESGRRSSTGGSERRRRPSSSATAVTTASSRSSKKPLRDADVTIVAELDGGLRREVMTQRSAVMIEDAIMNLGKPLDLQTLLHRHPRYAAINTTKQISREQRPVEEFAYKSSTRLSQMSHGGGSGSGGGDAASGARSQLGMSQGTSLSQRYTPDGRPIWNKTIVISRPNYERSLRSGSPYIDASVAERNAGDDGTEHGVTPQQQAMSSSSASSVHGSMSASSGSSGNSHGASKSPRSSLGTSAAMGQSSSNNSSNNSSSSNKKGKSGTSATMKTTGMQTASQRGHSDIPGTASAGIQTAEAVHHGGYHNNNHTSSSSSSSNMGRHHTTAGVGTDDDAMNTSTTSTTTSLSRSHHHGKGLLSRLVDMPRRGSTASTASGSHQRTAGGRFSDTHTSSSETSNNILEHQGQEEFQTARGNTGGAGSRSSSPLGKTHGVDTQAAIAEYEAVASVAHEIGGDAGRVVMMGGVPVAVVEVEPPKRTRDETTNGEDHQSGGTTQSVSHVVVAELSNTGYFSATTTSGVAQALPTAGLSSSHPAIIQQRRERAASPEQRRGGGGRSVSPGKTASKSETTAAATTNAE